MMSSSDALSSSTFNSVAVAKKEVFFFWFNLLPNVIDALWALAKDSSVMKTKRSLILDDSVIWLDAEFTDLEVLVVSDDDSVGFWLLESIDSWCKRQKRKIPKIIPNRTPNPDFLGAISHSTQYPFASPPFATPLQLAFIIIVHRPSHSWTWTLELQYHLNVVEEEQTSIQNVTVILAEPLSFNTIDSIIAVHWLRAYSSKHFISKLHHVRSNR